MDLFHIAIIVFCSTFLLSYCITREIQKFIRDKKEMQEYYCREFIRQNTNIDVK